MFTSASVSPEGTLAAANDYDDMTTVWETSSGSSRFTVTDKTFSLVGMKLRRVPPTLIVEARIRLAANPSWKSSIKTTIEKKQ